MFEWYDVRQIPLPRGMAVLMSDGEDMAVGTVDAKFGWLHLHGAIGYEHEDAFSLEDVRFWMPIPRLPNERDESVT